MSVTQKMTMMKQNLFSVFALTAALTGCQQSQIPDSTLLNSGAVEVCMNSATGGLEGSHTRVPMQGSTAPVMTARVLLSGTSGAYTSEADDTKRFFDGTMTFNGSGAVGFNTTKQNYPSDGSAVYVCGLYPSTGWTAVSAASTADYTLDGKTDVMVAAEVETRKTDAQGSAPSYKTLSFTHLLTNLIIKAKVDATAGAPAASKIQELWGDITGISLQKAGGIVPKNKVTVSLKEGSAATVSAFSGTTAVGFYKASGTAFASYAFEDDAFEALAVPATEVAVAYSLIAPIVAKGGENADFELLVKTAVNTTGITVPLSLSVAGDTQGKYCEITLTFKATEISVKSTIANWTAGGNASGSLQ